MTPKNLLKIAVAGPFGKGLTYCCDDQVDQKDLLGMRVQVPLGKRQKVGVVTATLTTMDFDVAKLKTIDAVIDEQALFDSTLLACFNWMADYYHESLGDIIHTALPAALTKGQVFDAPPLFAKTIQPEQPHLFNSDQQAAFDWFQQNNHHFAIALLDGVTGSGKTEVYLQSIESVLKQGRQALVLVPEIGLTPQTLSRFEQRFNVPVLPYHSGLTDKQKRHTWYHAHSGEAKVIIGTRSAVLMPFKQLGLIVIDEEHDLSFKQQSGVRYCAREVAIKRASLHNILIMLGSATPALESLYNAESGRYQWLPLHQRAGVAKPAEQFIIDMRQQPIQAGLSKSMQSEMQAHLNAGNQVMLFLNRRGYSNVLLCHHCGWSAKHEACDRHYTIHQHPPGLRCHHCDVVKPMPMQCPECGKKDFVPLGAGTQRLETHLQTAFPDKTILRIDRDATRQKGELDRRLAQIHAGEADILIGTQMLAKGHHFPNITMVGIIDIDSALFSQDFRALERMGQLIVQVAGRAGRAEKLGKVYLQTHQPQHALLNDLLQQGYLHFAKQLLQERKAALWPPFTAMATLAVRANQLEPVHMLLMAVREQLQQWQTNGVEYYGPLPSLLPRAGGYHRQLIVLQAKSRKALHIVLDGLNHWLQQQKLSRKVHWRIDVDPQEF